MSTVSVQRKGAGQVTLSRRNLFRAIPAAAAPVFVGGVPALPAPSAPADPITAAVHAAVPFALRAEPYYHMPMQQLERVWADWEATDDALDAALAPVADEALKLLTTINRAIKTIPATPLRDEVAEALRVRLGRMIGQHLDAQLPRGR